MIEKELISIIIPIYNVEKYLEECIESVLKQTYKNLEIILVDDGSPDNCGKICDEYTKKDNRIKTIHKENGGLSDARNIGLKTANGRYVTFIDSDDYVDKRYIELLYKSIIENNVAISQCNILKINNENEIIEKIGYLENCLKKGKELIKEQYINHTVENVVVWNKMYSIDLFKNRIFPVGKIHEDEFVTYRLMYDAKKISIVNEYLYNYRQNPESITGKSFNLKRLDILDALEERLEFFKQVNEEELYSLTLDSYLHNIREFYIKIKEDIDENEKTLKILKQKYRKNYKSVLKCRYISFGKKIKWGIFYVMPNVWYKLKKGIYE